MPRIEEVRATRAADNGHGLAFRVHKLADHDVIADARP